MSKLRKIENRPEVTSDWEEEKQRYCLVGAEFLSWGDAKVLKAATKNHILKNNQNG